MKKVLAILLSIIIILGALWFAPYTSTFMQTKTRTAYASVLGKIGVKEKNVEMFVPGLQSNIGAKKVVAKKGYVSKEGIYISNSKSRNFANNLLEINKVSMNVDVESLSTNVFTINEITIDGIKLNIDTNKDGITNIETTVSDIASYIISQRDSLLNAIRGYSSDNLAEKGQAVSIFENTLLGDYSKFAKISEKLGFAVVGANEDFMNMLKEIANSGTGDEASKELGESNLLIEKLILENNKIVVDGIDYKIPNLELRDISSSGDIMNKSKDINAQALTQFNKELQSQENNIKALEPKVKEISGNIGATIQKAIIDFMTYPLLDTNKTEE